MPSKKTPEPPSTASISDIPSQPHIRLKDSGPTLPGKRSRASGAGPRGQTAPSRETEARARPPAPSGGAALATGVGASAQASAEASPEMRGTGPQRPRLRDSGTTSMAAALDIAAKLKGHQLLRWLSPAQVERIAAAGELELYQAGEAIVSEGERADALFLVLQGRQAVYKSGMGERPLAELHPSEFFGEMSLVEPKTRSATVLVLEDTEVFRLPHTALRGLAREDPLAMNALLVAIVHALSDRLRRMNELVTTIGELSDWLASSLV